MVNYSKLGYNTLDEYNIDFLDTLLKTNRSYDFFVDWDKVFSKLENNVVEISILNSLSKLPPEKVNEKFKEILKKYPECIPILPTILAIRDTKVDVFDIGNKTFKNIDFSKSSFKNDEVIKFSKETGLLNLFSEINDLYSYLTGTEVGLDTHARKSRSGHVFENIIGDLLKEVISNKPNYSLKIEDSTIKIKRKKRADFVIYKEGIPEIVVECNFYGTTGSKPIETANAYIDLQKQIKDSGMEFIWVTDGFGWKKMFSSLKSTSKSIDYVLNYNMLKDNILKII
jgi:type II restriction enzyme